VTRVQPIESSPVPRVGLRDVLRRLLGRSAGIAGHAESAELESRPLAEPNPERFESRMGEPAPVVPPPTAGNAGAEDTGMSLRRHPVALLPAAAYLRSEVHHASTEEVTANLLTVFQHLAEFCGAPQVAERGRWSVLLPMPSVGVEQTTVRMEISPTDVEVRFETEHAPSRRLLQDCSPAVEDALRQFMVGDRDVEVRLW
jgi:hypothetical protein